MGTTKTKRPYRSLATATEAAESASREADLLRFAASDLALGRVSWGRNVHGRGVFRDTQVRVGFSRPRSASGGVLIQVWETDALPGGPPPTPTVLFSYLDDYVRNANHDYEFGGPSDGRSMAVEIAAEGRRLRG